jgi:hypothetical protein
VILLALAVGAGVCLHFYLRKSPIERQFDRITEGMTPGDVYAYLGDPSGPVNTEGLGGPAFSGDAWDTSDGTIFIVYENGRVIEKGWVSSSRATGPVQKLLEMIMPFLR